MTLDLYPKWTRGRALERETVTTKAGWAIRCALIALDPPAGRLTHAATSDAGTSRCRSEEACRKKYESSLRHWRAYQGPKPSYMKES